MAWLAWPSPADGPVQIGYLPIYVDLPLFVAEELGLFKKHDVRVELHKLSKSAELGEALTKGRIDAAASIATSVLLADESRDPGRLRVFLIDAENKRDYLTSIVVRHQSGINTPADLLPIKGVKKKIAFFPGTQLGVFGRLSLEALGVRPDSDITIIELSSDLHIPSLLNKSVDALMTYEPTGTQAVLQDSAVRLVPAAVESLVMEPWQAGVWVVSQALLDKREKEGRAVVEAIYEAVDSIRANPGRAKAFLAKYTSIDPDVALSTPNIPFTKLDEVDLQTLQKQADLHLTKGTIRRKINVGELMIPSRLIRDAR
ncbi:MAG: ABC transporter substrate-binding protein [Bdellovibrionales bacterium]|nr:ABC transporter substrate-binding protein [Bdellovibrionales bacterium]